MVFGRQGELDNLETCLEKALLGERQIVFVSGDSGIGKTALVDSFLARAARDSEILIAYGQCQELYGKGEAYMPVLEALERVGREAGTGRLVELLNRHAPTWLVQMPSLVDERAQEALQRRVASATAGRMLREIALALEALTAEIPLVLVLEDLHWSDYSTVDLISSLARRRVPARLLLIGTYRPTPVNTDKHPLRTVHQHLRIHRQCVDLALGGLERQALEEYLEMRLGAGGRSDHLVEMLCRLTEGNPLFLQTMVDDLLERGQLVAVDGYWQFDEDAEDICVADSLQQMIQEKLETLSVDHQRLLEAASVVGMDFSAAVVAAAVDQDVAEVEQCYQAMVHQGQFLRAHDEREGRELHFAFSHALHQSVLYQRLTVARQVQLHRSIGEALEALCEERPNENLAALAMHFERGRIPRKAVEYHVLAAQKTLRRSAYREAVDHLNRGLDFMKLLPDNDACRRQELALQVALGNSLVAIKGYGIEEVGQSFTRAQELAHQLDEAADELTALWGLAQFRVTRGELQEAGRLGEESLDRGQQQSDPELVLLGHRILGMTCHYAGEPAAAREHLETGLSLDASPNPRHEPDESVVHCRSLLGLVLWLLGFPDQALERCHEAVSIAKRINHPMSQGCAHHHRGMVLFFRREVDATRREAEALLKLAADHGLPQWSAWGNLLQGWVRSLSQPMAAVPQLCRALAAWRAIGARSMAPTYLAVLAAAFERAGDPKMGLSTLTEALDLVEEHGERLNEAELWRLKGRLLQTHQAEEAESCFRKSIEIARRQQALSWELWAATSLSRLLVLRGQARAARELLRDVCGRFTEGYETPDLKSAQALIQEIAVPLQLLKP
ncbi:MAG: AAA family ATPase [Acidobacteriota bacterium]